MITRELQDDTEGQFGGLGLVVQMKDNYVTVISPMDDSPGLRAEHFARRSYHENQRPDTGKNASQEDASENIAR